MEESFRGRAKSYLGDEAELTKKLGSGNEGFVWATTRNSAVKLFERLDNFKRELECYQRLAEFNLNKIDVFQVPELLRYDEIQLVIEMTLVTPPYLPGFRQVLR